jgi:prepilin-type N-terminal cleavage/methylation domain-containing protein
MGIDMNQLYRRAKTGGFTLIEVLLAVALFAIVIGLTYGFWRFFLENMQLTFDQSTAVEDAERVSSELVREIREMRESEVGAYPIETADDNQLTIYADYDADNKVEKLRYYLEGTQLVRGIIEPVGLPATYPVESEVKRVMVSSIANQATPIFSYYNGYWPTDTINNPLVSSSRQLAARMIGVKLIIQVGTKGTVSPVTITKFTALRAVKSN